MNDRDDPDGAIPADPALLPTNSRTTLPRVLGPVTAFSAIVGSVIGSGIFIVPARVAEAVPAVGVIGLIWILGGVFSLAGALTVAELGAMLPQAGGPYVYLKEAFGKLVGFLFGWTEFLVIRSGSVAALAAGFALYFGEVVPPPWDIPRAAWEAGVAISAMTTLAALNVIGARVGGGVQVFGTVLKVGTMAAMILLPLPFVLGAARVENLNPVWPGDVNAALGRAMLAAMVGVLWTYDGWINITALAEEIKDPGRNIPRAAILGTLTLIALYLGVTLSYHLVLPISDVAMPPGGRNVAGAYFVALLGAPGAWVIALVVMFSIFIALNGNALSGPRAYFAMARDGLLPHFLSRVHPRFRTPAAAIVTQTAWAALLTVAGATFLLIPAPGSGGVLPGWAREAWAKLNETPLYDVLFSFVIFGATFMYALTVASVFILRRTRPDLHRPYRTWGYPVTPIVYLAAAGLLLANMLRETFAESVVGLGIILAGVPAYYAMRRRSTSA
ncbi:APC family permease [Tautonia plasticadhaerens]|uniref:Serine/threonine exchanger SteT n=1 Tax=Tautonia plasticadhaerens TaxID=2527974 RepID=A0A518GWR7_9BACT|nr:amino acid permease [Tautonia plasticadhaerens]QDV33002.1 Serine/threonine exchanger SteT [Tautonia plasticadhaerens]